MEKILRKHTEALLVAVAVVLFAIVVSMFTWGVDDVVSQTNRALKFTPPTTKVGFDLTTASKLDLRGLLEQ